MTAGSSRGLALRPERGVKLHTRVEAICDRVLPVAFGDSGALPRLVGGYFLAAPFHSRLNTTFGVASD